jgi:hypothetical protein
MFSKALEKGEHLFGPNTRWFSKEKPPCPPYVTFPRNFFLLLSKIKEVQTSKSLFFPEKSQTIYFKGGNHK